jgi:hypothetical protein
VKPAPGKREAAEILRMLPPLLLGAEIAREIIPGELPPEVDRSRLPEGPLYAYELDSAMAEWIAALAEMARKPRSGSGTSRKRAGGGAGAKKRGPKPGPG